MASGRLFNSAASRLCCSYSVTLCRKHRQYCYSSVRHYKGQSRQPQFQWAPSRQSDNSIRNSTKYGGNAMMQCPERSREH